MKCLHICNDFSFTEVHKNLYTHLDELGLQQVIYNPTRQNTPIGNNTIKFKSPNSKIIYSKKLKKKHKILFRNKINYLHKDIELKCDIKTIDIIHATTLFSDGALAYKLHKKYNIPFIVAVRGTDIGIYLKYRPDLFFLLKNILKNSSRIIFLSTAIKNQFLRKKYVQLTRERVTDKSQVICNAIDDFWLRNISHKKPIKKPSKILYIGRFDKNKNTLNLIKAVLKLKTDFPNLEIHLVGKGGEYEEDIVKLANTHKKSIHFHGPIYDNKELRKIYLSNHIFAMPSHGETFGLVYMEALSQGLPILCSKNQGIDGVFDFKIGEFINSKSIDSIALGLKKIVDDYNTYQLQKINFDLFNWQSVSVNYLNLYGKTI